MSTDILDLVEKVRTEGEEWLTYLSKDGWRWWTLDRCNLLNPARRSHSRDADAAMRLKRAKMILSEFQAEYDPDYHHLSPKTKHQWKRFKELVGKLEDELAAYDASLRLGMERPREMRGWVGDWQPGVGLMGEGKIDDNT